MNRGSEQIRNNFNEIEENNEDFYLRVQKYKLSLYKDEKPPIPVVKLLGKAIGVQGDISTYVGQAKARKTYLISAVLIEALKPGTYGKFLEVTLPESKNKILWIDTEQSSFWCKTILNRAKLAGASEEKIENRLDLYSCRTFSIDEIKTLVETSLQRDSKIGLIIIDGSRELVTSINSEEEAKTTLQWLMTIATEHQLHVINILHLNPAKSGEYTKARGHLGTELQNKSEYVVSVTIEKENDLNSTVDAILSRGEKPDKATMYIDEEGLPRFMEHIPSIAKDTTPKHEGFENWDSLFQNAFKGSYDNRYSRNEMVENIHDYFNLEFGEPVPHGYGVHAIRKKWIPYMEANLKIEGSKEGNEVHEKFKWLGTPF